MEQDSTVSSSCEASSSEHSTPSDPPSGPLQSSEVSSSGLPACATDWFANLQYENHMTELGWRWKHNSSPEESSDPDSSDPDSSDEDSSSD